MELSNLELEKLAELKLKLSEGTHRYVIKFFDGTLLTNKCDTYLDCLQRISEADPRNVNYAKIQDDKSNIFVIDPDELALWRVRRERYRIEVRYCNHDQGKWVKYPNLIHKYENALEYQPGDFYERLRIIRLFDNRVVHEEESKVFKLFYSDGHYDFCTNCSYRMAESIGKVRCGKNGTDYDKLMIVEVDRKR
jgi:hypothetical protein